MRVGSYIDIRARASTNLTAIRAESKRLEYFHQPYALTSPLSRRITPPQGLLPSLFMLTTTQISGALSSAIGGNLWLKHSIPLLFFLFFPCFFFLSCSCNHCNLRLAERTADIDGKSARVE